MTALAPAVLERLETIVLARLALPSRTAPHAVALARLTRRFAPARIDQPAWRDLVEAALAALQARQIVGPDRKVLRTGELQRRVGQHTARQWENWTDRLLPALALGIRLDDGNAMRRLAIADGWASAIAGRILGLWHAGPPPTLNQLGDALVWRDLELPGKAEECPRTLRAHFLKRHIATANGTPAQLVRQIAARTVKAPNVAPATLRAALVGHWLAGNELRDAAASVARATEADPATSMAANATPAARPGEDATERVTPSLVEAARGAAQDAHEGVFGDRKVFISSVWHVLRERPAWSRLALDDFKQQLVVAHRNQQLVLARADLVAAMDPALVAASETRTDGATFHFIVREPVR